MDSLFFAIATIVMVIAACLTTCWGLLLHHKRETDRIELKRQEQDRMFLMSERALEQGILPPAFQQHVRRDY